MRVFIAIDLLPEIKKAIGTVIERLKAVKAPVKWVEEENLHITLKFLGEIPEDKLKRLEETVKRTVEAFKPFQVSFEGGGVFPNEKRPRVIWIGTKEGNKEIASLAKKLEENLAANGLGKKEEREFNSHVTIGRVKTPGNLAPLMEKITEVRGLNFGKETVEGVAIMQSTLTPKGPIYKPVVRIKW